MLSRDGQNALDALLFPRGAFLERGSALHRDFGEFFERYVAFRKKELARDPRGTEGGVRHGAAAVGGGGEGRGGVDGVAAKAGDGLGRWVAREDDMTEEARWKRKLAQFVTEMPASYDQRYRINFAIVPPRVAGGGGGGGGVALGESEVKEAKRALLLFEDYRQRKALSKIRKMREDQRALPIFAFRDALVQAVQREQVVLIAGDTGCGKSTQVPQYLIQAGFERVACTQPRRISTMSLCARVATETLNEHGSQVAKTLNPKS